MASLCVVPVPCRLIQPMSAGSSPAPSKAARMACRAPAPLGSGADMCQASELAPPPSRATPAASAGSRCIRNSTPASPMLMPRRLAENGRHRASSTASRVAKPLMVRRHSVSAPPQTTASHSPSANRRRADSSARALEVQAVDRV